VHSGNQGWFSRLNGRVEQGFERLRSSYAELLAILLTRRLIVPIAAAALLALGAVMFLFVGRDFFPRSMAGRSSYMSESRPAPGSKRPSRCFNGSRTRSAKSFRQANAG